MMEWLRILKKGDTVITTNRYGKEIHIVTHDTKTQIHVNNMKFRRQDGQQIGPDLWARSSIQEATKERCIKINSKDLKKRLINIIEQTNLSSLCNLTLNKIINTINDDSKLREEKINE